MSKDIANAMSMGWKIFWGCVVGVGILLILGVIFLFITSDAWSSCSGRDCGNNTMVVFGLLGFCYVMVRKYAKRAGFSWYRKYFENNSLARGMNNFMGTGEGETVTGNQFLRILFFAILGVIPILLLFYWRFG